MVVPVGERYQQTLYLMRKTDGKLKSEALRATLFVPMTGEAEAQRKVKPDPAKPQIVNGSFEETTTNADGDDEPTGWHYQRQLNVKSDCQRAGRQALRHVSKTPNPAAAATPCKASPSTAARFRRSNFTTGSAAKTSARAPSPKICRASSSPFTTSAAQPSAKKPTGQFDGTFAWREETGRIRVPLKAREAIIRIGLLGASASFRSTTCGFS